MSMPESTRDGRDEGARGGAAGRQWILWFLLLALAVSAAGVAVYRHQVAQARKEALDSLATVATLKTGQIVAWRAERLADARLVAMLGSPLFETAVVPWLRAPQTAAAGDRVAQLIGQIRTILGYHAVLIAAPEGKLLVGAGAVPQQLEEATRDLVVRAAGASEPVFGQLSLGAAPGGVQGVVQLDVAAVYRDAAGAPVAVLVLRSAPEMHLYPLLRAWPAPSPSAETLLVRREGEEVVFLNPLRHVDDAPLMRRRPLADRSIVGAQATSGKTGIVEGVDYRGVEVVADLRPVPGSDWLMVSKVDADEILADARRRGATVALVTAAAVVALGLALLALASLQRRNAWRARYQAERNERLALEEYRATLNGIGDGVLSTDAQGLVRRVNPVAEALTGWTEAEAQGRPVREVFAIVNEDTRAEVENPVTHVLRDGRIVGLANHTLLIARDGTERPIADSGAPVRRDDGTLAGVVLVFRDQSAERDAINALRASESRFRRLFEGSADAMLLLDMDSRRFVDGNAAAVVMLGLADRAEMLDMHPAELSPPQQPDGRDSAAKAAEMIETARCQGFHRFEWVHCSHARAPFPVDVLLTPITSGSPALAVTTWRDLSEAKRIARERELAATELAERVSELARFNRAAVDRELRMVELKREGDALRARLGEPPRYRSVPRPGEDAEAS